MCKQNRNDEIPSATADSQQNGGTQQPTATATKPTSEDGTALLTSDGDSATPLNYMEAIRSSKADEWRRPCDNEIASLMQHKVWEVEVVEHDSIRSVSIIARF
jgi:hypothetical protein